MSEKKEIDVSAVIRVIDRATAPIRRIQATVGRVVEPVARVNRAMGRISTAAGFPKVVGGFKNVGTSVRDLAGHVSGLLGPLSAVGAAASLAGLGKAISDFAEYGGHVDDVSTQIGVAAKKVQEWTYAAKLGGVEGDALTDSLARLNRNLADAAGGKNKDLSALMRKLGISAKDASGHLRGAEQIFPEIADALSRINDPVARAAVGNAFLGKSWADLMPVLKDGSAGLKAAGKEARELGIVLSDQEIANAAQLGDELDRLTTGARGLSLGIASQLMPTILPLLGQLTEWLKANRQIIATKIGDFVQRVAAAIKQIDWNKIAAGISSFASGIERVVDFIGGWQNALIALVVFLNGGLVAAILNVGASVIRLGVIFLTNPIAAAVAVIAGLVYVIYRNWDGIVGWFNEKLARVKAAFSDGLLKGVLTALAEFNPTRLFAEAINGLIKYIFGIDMFEVGSKWIAGFADAIMGRVESLASGLKDTLSTLSFGLLGGGQPALSSASAGVPAGTFIGGRGPAPGRVPLALAAGQAQQSNLKVTIDGKNMPQGMSLKTEARGPAINQMEVGRSRQGAL